MISLPGLLLVPGRFEEAREVLRTFASHRKDGLIPNLFDDYTGEAHYNTVDASLWFINAACLYRQHSGDALTFRNDLLPACLDIVENYRRGTAFSIKMDESDALIMAGDASTQLTWMDAKRDGIAFTPRHGKPVEINALWVQRAGEAWRISGWGRRRRRGWRRCATRPGNRCASCSGIRNSSACMTPCSRRTLVRDGFRRRR